MSKRYFTYFARAAFRKLPDEGYFIKRKIKALLVKKEIAISKLSNYLRGVTVDSPYIVYWIDPALIEYHTNYKRDSSDWEDWIFDQHKFVPKIQDGDWDIPVHRVSEMRAFRAIYDRIHHGKAWQTSDFYQYAVKQIESGRTVWRYSSSADFDRHCDKIDKLIESISNHGYLERSMDKMNRAYPGYGEIIINVGRDGSYLFQDGRHRLAIALALGLKQVPVQVLVRHSEWASCCEHLKKMATHENEDTAKKGVLYQNPLHFDLVGISHLNHDRT